MRASRWCSCSCAVLCCAVLWPPQISGKNYFLFACLACDSCVACLLACSWLNSLYDSSHAFHRNCESSLCTRLGFTTPPACPLRPSWDWPLFPLPRDCCYLAPLLPPRSPPLSLDLRCQPGSLSLHCVFEALFFHLRSRNPPLDLSVSLCLSLSLSLSLSLPPRRLSCASACVFFT